MQYLKHYEALCLSRQQLVRKKSTDNYYESHHITPRSLGGSNDPSNLVLLTPREHYIAHLLLYYHYKTQGGPALQKMAFALVSMSSTCKHLTKRGQLISARGYQLVREAARVAVLGRKVEDTSNYRQQRSQEHREAIRQARLNSPPRSSETKQKQKEKALARGSNFTTNRQKAICPHCSKQGQATAMKRWHFSNCSVRKEVSHA